MRELKARPCTTELYELGESCRWDDVRGELYWVDILSGRFFRATADDARVDIVSEYHVEGFVSAVAPLSDRDCGWIVAENQSISLLDERGALRELSRPEAHREKVVRMNDGAADPWGRFWVGSMAFDSSPGQGNLYRYHESTGAEVVLGGTTISNGLGWSPDCNAMYYVDSGPATLSVFALDPAGEISSRRVLVQFDKREGEPDGLCVDADGAIWVALWGGYQVRRYSPDGQLLARVDLPTAQPSSCAIGGSNATTLYVTTAREDMTESALAVEPDAGRLFCVDVGVPGLPLNSYRPS